MEPELLLAFISATVAMLSGGILSTESFQKTLRKYFKGNKEKGSNYSERLFELTKKLADSSAEVDVVLQELSSVANERQEAVESLETTLSELESKEQKLAAKVKALEDTPVEAANHFAELVSQGQKRGAKRDYILFGSGVILTTLISVALQYFDINFGLKPK